jgi:hypothetical protein
VAVRLFWGNMYVLLRKQHTFWNSTWDNIHPTMHEHNMAACRTLPALQWHNTIWYWLTRDVQLGNRTRPGTTIYGHSTVVDSISLINIFRCYVYEVCMLRMSALSWQLWHELSARILVQSWEITSDTEIWRVDCWVVNRSVCWPFKMYCIVLYLFASMESHYITLDESQQYTDIRY